MPLVASLALGTPNVVAMGLAVGAVAAFFAHEPLLILLGQRGTKARTHDGPRAAKRLQRLSAIALVAGGVGFVSAPTIVRLAVLPPMLLGCLVMWFVWRKEEKTALGEIAAAAALSGVGLPIAIAEGITLFDALLVWFVWTISFTLATLCVRAVIARAKGVGPLPLVAAYVTTIGAVGASVGLAHANQIPNTVPIALLPFEILGLGMLVAPVRTKHLRKIGWGLVAASLLTGAFVVAMFR